MLLEHRFHPLVNLQKANWKITIFNGKSTISMAIFNSYVSHYQRVSEKYSSKPC